MGVHRKEGEAERKSPVPPTSHSSLTTKGRRKLPETRSQAQWNLRLQELTLEILSPMLCGATLFHACERPKSKVELYFKLLI
jgi:hypothetical protein